LSADFGHRSAETTLIADIMASVKSLKHARNHLASWMRPEKRSLDFPLGLLGARARIEYQPKGVVGILTPWNFPLNLTFGPLADVLAAGNRAMIKASEFTPATSELLQLTISQAFHDTEVAVVLGDAEVGQAFSELPFDHLVFTGGTAIGRHVMAAAAKNLVPVTLELGGKSPTLISRSAHLPSATERIVLGKLMNAGQVCLAPDYLLVPAELESEVITGLRTAAARLYPTLLANDDYTSLISPRHLNRLTAHLEDARAKGAEVLEVNPAAEDFSRQPHHKMPFTLLRQVTGDMSVMQEEIFGPLLPILTYQHVDEAIDFVRSRERPLALYWFGTDPDEERRVLDRTISGGATINDILFHFTANDLPFGGSGSSGMGHYHGREGFKTFSHAKSVYHQPKIDLSGLAGFKPPYNQRTQKSLARELKP
jgi:coniferyl-aldehyde dehydrogenase